MQSSAPEADVLIAQPHVGVWRLSPEPKRRLCFKSSSNGDGNGVLNKRPGLAVARASISGNGA
jgi:hypothetical protein